VPTGPDPLSGVSIEAAGTETDPTAAARAATPELKMGRLQYPGGETGVASLMDDAHALDEAGDGGRRIPVSGNQRWVVLGKGRLQLDFAEHEDSSRR
jgi:hypothetical protein